MRSKVIAVGLGLLGSGIVACSEEHAPRGPLAGEIPPTAQLAGGSMTAGFAAGPLRVPRTVSSFRITKDPITVAQYKQCVAVGACSPPSLKDGTCRERFSPSAYRNHFAVEGTTFDVDDRLPVTCVASPQAKAYCSWQGGALPTSNQWLLAARGPAPTRYSWGDTAPTCDQHPGGSPRGSADTTPWSTPCVSDLKGFAVGSHPKGASPAGIEDVLLTRGELLMGDPQAQFGACINSEFCIAQGVFPGSIDSVRASVAKDKSIPTYGFRCVFDGVTQ